MPAEVPEEYRNREQTFFKHKVLKAYLGAWSQKLASASQHGVAVRLWYVDCFAGPWESQTVDRSDTSVAIGLAALEDALSAWTVQRRGRVEAGAIFVEANGTSAERLEEFVKSRSARGVKPYVLRGEFGSRVADIKGLIGSDAAFVFVDPTGWKGAGMQHITPLLEGRYRDVMVNVMFHHLNRWKNDPREFLRRQIRELFGLGESELPQGLDEAALMNLYREQLRHQARMAYVADLAVPHPTVERTFFRLVVGGRHREVVRLFRDVEEQVVGREAGAVRADAKARVLRERTGQLSLGLLPAIDGRYQSMRDSDLAVAMTVLEQRLVGGAVAFGDLWPNLLCDYHVTRKHLADAVLDRIKGGTIAVKSRMGDRERTIKDRHRIVLR